MFTLFHHALLRCQWPRLDKLQPSRRVCACVCVANLMHIFVSPCPKVGQATFEGLIISVLYYFNRIYFVVVGNRW
jgi:hypothetical protein